MTDKIKQFNMELPEDLHSDFKAECARRKRAMGGKKGILTELITGWLAGDLNDI